jgi:UDP-N-acetylmuramate dehydrogenase
MIMGNGSNLLFPDNGYRGVIIKISRNMAKLNISNDIISTEAGTLLATVSAEAMKACLTGLEFGSGIPGTVGGAVYMNAGAYGDEIKDVFLSAEVLSEDGSINTYGLEEMNFSYRHSNLMESGILLSMSFKLCAGEYESSKEKTNELTAARRSKQPIDLPSAGSTFKRPPGLFAGKLIMDSGLRGYSIGGAQVSEKHCGFIVNKGGASYDDVVRLIEHIQKTVHNCFDVMLVPEVRIIK